MKKSKNNVEITKKEVKIRYPMSAWMDHNRKNLGLVQKIDNKDYMLSSIEVNHEQKTVFETWKLITIN